MSKKNILICTSCFARNYHFPVRKNALERLRLKKYCSSCKQTQWHNEHR